MSSKQNNTICLSVCQTDWLIFLVDFEFLFLNISCAMFIDLFDM